MYNFLQAYKIPANIMLKNNPWTGLFSKFKQPTAEQTLLIVNFLFEVGKAYHKENRGAALIITLLQHKYLSG